MKKRLRPKFYQRLQWVLLATLCFLPLQAFASDFVLLVPKTLDVNSVDRVLVNRLFLGLDNRINGHPVTFALRKEKSVSDDFVRKYLRSSWLDYLDSLNLAFFQQQLKNIPPILTLKQYVAYSSDDALYVEYAKRNEVSELKLPATLKVISIIE